TDDTGQTVTADSDPTTSVKDVAPTLSVSISGDAVESQTLTAAPVQGSDEVETVTYQWQSNDGVHGWQNISGATSSTYQLQEGQEISLLDALPILTDDTGQTVTADSDPTTSVKDVAPTLSVSISGDAVESQTLTAAPVQGSD